jgi:hypothetical protein
MTKTTRDMSVRHVEHLAALFEGRCNRGSGNQAKDQMDGKQVYRSGQYVFAWDGKSTLGLSIGITRAMWEKAKEQAHWAIPILPLRFYANARLTDVDADLVVVEASVLADLQRGANLLAAIKETGCLNGTHDDPPGKSTCKVCGSSAYDRPQEPDDDWGHSADV